MKQCVPCRHECSSVLVLVLIQLSGWRLLLGISWNLERPRREKAGQLIQGSGYLFFVSSGNESSKWLRLNHQKLKKKKRGVFLFPGVFKNKDFVQWLLHCEILNGKWSSIWKIGVARHSNINLSNQNSVSEDDRRENQGKWVGLNILKTSPPVRGPAALVEAPSFLPLVRDVASGGASCVWLG